jgi:colanic acid/amylovoran biosynthesis protein
VKIVVVNICGALNSGDHTQLVAFLKIVKEAYPNATVTCVHRNPEIHRDMFPGVQWLETLGTSHSLAPWARRLGNLRGLVPALLRCPVLLPRAQRETYASLRGADIIIAHPGGYFGNPGPHLYASLLHMTLSRRGKLLAFSQSIGPFRSRCAKICVHHVLSRAACLTVREPCTYEYVTGEMGFQEKTVRLMPDVAFFQRDSDEHGAKDVLQHLGVGESEAIAATTFWPSPRLGVPYERYFGILGKAANRLYEDYGIRTIALRQIGTAEGIEGDAYLLGKAEPYFGQAGRMAYDYYPPEVIRGIVRLCRVTYGTRMHANVFSLAQGVPTVAISYNHKTNGIMRMCGQERFVVDLRHLTLESLLRPLTEALAEEASIRRELKKCVEGFQTYRRDMIDLMQACVI